MFSFFLPFLCSHCWGIQSDVCTRVFLLDAFTVHHPAQFIGVHLAQLQEEECAYHFVKHSCLLRLQLISAAEKTAAALFLIYSTSCSRVAERKRGEGEERKVSMHMGENLLHNKPKIQTKIKRDGR